MSTELQDLQGVIGGGIMHTSVPRPGQRSQQPAGQRQKFPCGSGCTRCVDQHLSGGGGVKDNSNHHNADIPDCDIVYQRLA